MYFHGRGFNTRTNWVDRLFNKANEKVGERIACFYQMQKYLGRSGAL